MSWLTSLLLALLPASCCARFLEAVRLWLVEILHGLIDEQTQTFFDLSAAELTLLEANLTDAENLLRLAVGVRVCELNGWSKKGLRRTGGRACDSNPTPERLMARLERCVFLLANFEDHAQRRAYDLSALSFFRALSPASPAKAGAQTPRAKLAEGIERAARLPGSRPSPGMRLLDSRRTAPAGGRLLAQAS